MQEILSKFENYYKHDFKRRKRYRGPEGRRVWIPVKLSAC